MGHITLLEDLSNELRHASSYEHDLDLCRRLFQNFTELTLADEFTIAILSFEQQVTHVLLSHQAHACVCLVKAVARNMKTAWPLSDHPNELILRGD